MSAENLIEQLKTSVEFLTQELNDAKTPVEKKKIIKELASAEDQLQRIGRAHV